MLEWYQQLPLHIDPIAFSIGSFSVRWYAVSYIIGFGVVCFILMWRIRRDDFEKTAQIFNFQFPPQRDKLEAKISNKIPNSKFQIPNKNTRSMVNGLPDGISLKQKWSNVVLDYLLISFVAALVGGRLGYVLLYNLPYYVANPTAVISPYDSDGEFIGLFGMSYHGALVAIVIATWIFLRKRNIDFLRWADFVVPAATAGYFFGRIGNFLNGELYGRVTDSALGMYFVRDSLHLRHPSQLYEAFLEGLLLFVILWRMRRSNFGRGKIFAVYLFGYGLLRIFVEQFRQPDAQLGFLWNQITMGQALSIGMAIFGLLLLIPKKEK